MHLVGKKKMNKKRSKKKLVYNKRREIYSISIAFFFPFVQLLPLLKNFDVIFSNVQTNTILEAECGGSKRVAIKGW